MTTIATQFRHFDTRRPDGVTIKWDRLEHFDQDASLLDWMDENDEQDAERIKAWRNDEWHFVGIQAQATVIIIKNGHGISYQMTSGGLWGIQSDSGEAYFTEVFEDEKRALIDDLKAMGEHFATL